jgi:signal transduction histidine kinase/CheY-like chemotaxis protein
MHGLWLRLCWLIALSLGLSGAWADASGKATHVVTQVQRAPGLCEEAEAAKAVTLPDDWRAEGLPTPAPACYRFELSLSSKPSQAWALRLDRLPANHRVRVNGVVVNTRHMGGETSTSMGTLPYLFEIPDTLMQAGLNRIEIDTRMGWFRKPGISPLEAGPLADMREPFDRWYWWTQDIPRFINLAAAGMAVFLLLAWRIRQKDILFQAFGALMLIISLRNTAYFMEISHWPNQVVDWLFFTAQCLATYHLAIFGLNYAGKDAKSVMWPLRLIGFGMPLVALAGFWLGQLQPLRMVAFPMMLVCGVWVVFLVVQRAIKAPWQEAIPMTLGPLLTMVAMGHDYLFLTPLLPTTAIQWSPYAAPLTFMGYAYTLMRQAVQHMNMAEQLNVTLEERVKERTLALEAANRSKTRFLAAASHDLRQPTAAIGLLVSLLRQQNGHGGDSREIVNMLDEAVASMESLLVGLLDISRLDAGAVQPQFQSVALHDLFQAVKVHEQSAAEAKGLRLSFRLPSGPEGQKLMVTTDPLLVHSVLRNLLSNAIRYTPKGGVLVVARRKGKRRVRIQVWDTGIGIAPDQIERIFEEFYQVGNAARDRSRGIGLGLAIVRRTAGVLGEQVTVRSRLGKGSVFSFELPVHVAAAQRPVLLRSAQQALLGCTLWLVEDDVLLRRTMTELLQSWGAQVRAWSDGEALLGDMNLRAGLDARDAAPDILLTDYRLPGMDGLALCQLVAAHWGVLGKDVRTLIISGDTDPGEISRLAHSGVNLLSKPFRSERLQERLLALLPPSSRPPHAEL